MLQLNFPNPVTSSKDFFGRKIERARVERTLLSAAASGKRQPVVILGERRVGKTSLQNVTLQRLQEQAPGQIIPLVIGPLGIHRAADFAHAILRSLAAVNETNLPSLPGDANLAQPTLFDELFSHLSSSLPTITYLVCVDEFEEIVRTVGGEESLRIDALIHHLSGESSLPVNLFFTMTSLPPLVSYSIPTPFTSMAEMVDLQPLSTTETVGMIQELLAGKVILAEEQAYKLAHLSGGHPYFTKLLLANLLDSNRTIPWLASEADCDQAVAAAVQDSRAQLAVKNLYQHHFNDEERFILIWLAGRDEPLETSEVQSISITHLTAARELVRRDYLSEKAGGFDYRIRYLHLWLRDWEEYGEERERLHIVDSGTGR